MSDGTTPSTIALIDADSHLTETPDLWTSRLPAKWLDQAPRLDVDPHGVERWRTGDRWLHSIPSFSQGRSERPGRWADVDPACHDGPARLQWMDRFNIRAQVLYPNLVGFETFALLEMEPELQRLVLRAYNDHLVDVAAADPDRFVLITALPFWDVDESIREMTRCRELGHRGVLWADTMRHHGLPHFTDPHWDRFYAAAQDLDVSINFHVATGAVDDPFGTLREITDRSQMIIEGLPLALGNARTIAEIVLSGLCDRFPRLPFVSVESGFGYVPYVLENLDWLWSINPKTARSGRLSPSEYFARQCYTMFWFESRTLAQLPDFADNVMFETDFPHPQGLTPTPYSFGVPDTNATIQRHIATHGETVMRKVLHDTAARLYHVAG